MAMQFPNSGPPTPRGLREPTIEQAHSTTGYEPNGVLPRSPTGGLTEQGNQRMALNPLRLPSLQNTVGNPTVFSMTPTEGTPRELFTSEENPSGILQLQQVH